MGIEDIKKKIIADAEKERERILEEAENKAAEILENGRKAAEIERERIISQYEEEGKREYNRIITEAKMESRLKLLAVKQEGLDKVFNKAFEALRNLEYYGEQGKDYWKFLENLICEEAEGGEELILPPEDKDQIIYEILELVSTEKENKRTDEENKKYERLKQAYGNKIKKDFNIGVIKGGEELVLSPKDKIIEEFFKSKNEEVFKNLENDFRFKIGEGKKEIILLPKKKDRPAEDFLKNIEDGKYGKLEHFKVELAEEKEGIFLFPHDEGLLIRYCSEKIFNEYCPDLEEDFRLESEEGEIDIALYPKRNLIEELVMEANPSIYKKLKEDFDVELEEGTKFILTPREKSAIVSIESIRENYSDLEEYFSSELREGKIILSPSGWFRNSILKKINNDEYGIIRKDFTCYMEEERNNILLSSRKKDKKWSVEMIRRNIEEGTYGLLEKDFTYYVMRKMGKIVLRPRMKRKNETFLKKISDEANKKAMDSIISEITEEEQIVIKVQDQEKLMDDYDFLERIKERLFKREDEKGLRDDFDFHMAPGLREITLSPRGAHSLVEIFLKKECPIINGRLEKDFIFKEEKDEITLYHSEGKTIDTFLEEVEEESEELGEECRKLRENFKIEKNKIALKPEKEGDFLDNLISKALYEYLTIPTDDSLTDTDRKWIIPGGFILRRGNIDINQKFDQYKNDIKYDIEADVAEILFSGDTK